MAYELKPGFGNIFKNKHKSAPNHPEYRGEIRTPDGQLLEVALWVKDGKNGKFFSAKIQEPRPKQPKDYPAGAADKGDVPF